MKVLASLKPYYYYLIGEKIKTLEIRKSDLKNLPQDVLFYMSKDEKSFAKIPKEFQEKYRKHFGKVGIEFICDNVERFDVPYPAWDKAYLNDILKNSCLTYTDLHSYIGSGNSGYGWHISDLKIYDKPRELSEFRKPLDRVYCSYYRDYCEEGCVGFGSTDYVCNDYWNWEKGLTRPPQSWCYVEER